MLTELAAPRQDRAPASSFSSSRNMEKRPQKTYRLLCYESQVQRKQLSRAQTLHLEAKRSPSARAHVPFSPHPGPARPHAREVQSYWERQVPGRLVKMHQNKISLLLSQHLHQHLSSLPPQQSLETLQDLEMPTPLPGSGTQTHPVGMGQLASGGDSGSPAMGESKH